MTEFSPLHDREEAALVALWERCDLTRPWNPADQDITEFRAHPAADILVAREGKKIIASVAVGHDGHRAWAYYVGVDPEYRGRGLGRAAMDTAEGWARDRGIVKLHLMVRESNSAVLDFYEGLGYEDSEVRVMQKWLSPERARLYSENADDH